MFTYCSSGGQQILPNLALAHLQTQCECCPVLVHFLSLEGVSPGRKQESKKSVLQNGRGLFLLGRVCGSNLVGQGQGMLQKSHHETDLIQEIFRESERLPQSRGKRDRRTDRQADRQASKQRDTQRGGQERSL